MQPEADSAVGDDRIWMRPCLAHLRLRKSELGIEFQGRSNIRRDDRIFEEPPKHRSHAAHAYVFNFGVVEYSVFRALSSGSGLLHSTEWRDLGGNDARIQAHDAVLESLSDAPAAHEIASVEICRQAEFRIIGHGNRFPLRSKLEQRPHRAESFLAGDHHVGGHAGEDGGFEKSAAERMAL